MHDEAKASVEAFEMAWRETAKAWHSTALLSMVKPARVQEIMDAFAGGDANQMAQCLTSIAGPAYDAYSIKACIDGSKLLRMSTMVAQLLARDLLPCVDSNEVMERLCSIGDRARQWIESGQAPGHSGSADLVKVSDLIGGAPASRLALVAPLAPALSAAEVVLKAQAQAFPFDHGVHQ